MGKNNTNDSSAGPKMTAQPGAEYAELEWIETRTRHSWERNNFGEIKIEAIKGQCRGPVCRLCGFTFCVDCGIAEAILACSYVPAYMHRPGDSPDATPAADPPRLTLLKDSD
jgi:hypothetical protein